ncbi:hypothetical protein GCM10010521_68540 [Streptomyces rameus]|uniref:Uncharacterized protein n=1 Tax=Streptomyces rameus TaxID=68261 RepID=A0ABN3V6B1_9ACTN
MIFEARANWLPKAVEPTGPGPRVFSNLRPHARSTPPCGTATGEDRAAMQAAYPDDAGRIMVIEASPVCCPQHTAK